MKVLIIGLGSIALKHIKALRDIRSDVQFVALRSSVEAKSYPGVVNLYCIEDAPADLDFVIISNSTFLHYQTIEDTLKLEIPIFLEKPPLMNLQGIDELLLKVKSTTIYTAFNLRFHPVIQWFKENLDVAKVLEVQSYCGSYLPDWRPDQDYRKNYSAISSLGGGVHLDLIHELDYLVYLFGAPLSFKGFVSQFSKLEIDSMDHAHYWLKYDHFGASVLLNYFRPKAKRTVDLVCEDEVYSANIFKSEIRNGDDEVVFSSDSNFLMTYKYQMQYFLDHLESGEPMMNSLEESIETLKICLNADEG